MRWVLMLNICIALLSYRKPLYAYNSSSSGSSGSRLTYNNNNNNNNNITLTCSNMFVLDKHIQQLRYNFTDYKYELIHWSSAEEFTIVKQVGAGIYTDAYLAFSKEQHKDYVVKVYYRTDRMNWEKFIREILILQHLCGNDSNNIVRLTHVIHDNSNLLVNVMKEKGGGGGGKRTYKKSLVFEHIRDVWYHHLYPVLSPKDVKHYAYELLKGLAYAHSKGVIHRDLKPANVMIDHDRKALKIIDWASARFADEKQVVTGTMFIRSPEMILDYRHTDSSTDMWSYGCLLAAWFFRRNRFFLSKENRSPKDQIDIIRKTLGTADLLLFAKKYDLQLPPHVLSNTSSSSSSSRPSSSSSSSSSWPSGRVAWKQLKNKHNKNYATDLAFDLLDKLLIYDFSKRLSAKQALEHAYFHS